VTGPTVIVDAGLGALSGGGSVRLRTIPRRRAPWWRRGARWAPLDPADVIDALLEQAAPAVVLVRPFEADPGAACLGPLARLLGHRVVQLPRDPDEAAWSATVAGNLQGVSDEAFHRFLDVVSCGPAVGAPAPRRSWGDAGLAVPALRPETLARWAACAWRRCGWCRHGGPPGGRCATCGSPIADVAVER
jgi:hypothetical protein